jgi:hypothetical protein
VGNSGLALVIDLGAPFMAMDDDQSQGDFLSSVTDVSMVKFLLEDLHDDLLGKVQRFHYLNDLGEQNGRRTMLFGGANYSQCMG